MPSKCFVAGCRSNYNASSKVRVFSFPRDENLKNLWLQAIHREDKRVPSKSSKICEQHFKPEEIVTESKVFDPKSQEVIRVPLQKCRLDGNAIPSIFSNLQPIRKPRQCPLPSDSGEIPIVGVENNRDSAAETEFSHIGTEMRNCSVPGCRSNQQKPYVSVFKFPKNLGFRNLWLKKIGCPFLEVKDHSCVCINHFEKRFLVDRNVEGVKKRMGLKPGAVPTIFKSDQVANLSDDSDNNLQDNNMKSKGLRSVSTSDASKDSDDEFIGSPVSNQVNTTLTTDRPFIEVVKPNDFSDDQWITEEVFDDSSPIKPSPNSKSNSSNRPTSSNRSKNNMPSPYKHLPSVSVCLNDEDRINVQREISKSNKRSLSSCSNSSIGSSETVRSQPKRKKIEKPAPTVIGKKNDCYCWVCHRENVVLNCIDCPRAYHTKCAGEYGNLPDWVCPECKRGMHADSAWENSVLSQISHDKLCSLLRFSLNKMKQRAGVAFHQPVSLEHYPMYLHYVIHPMDFSLLEKNITNKVYGCTEAFLSDVKWILHNSCVFNGSQHPLSTNAKSMVKACDNDMQEIEICPDCFLHNIVRNKYWFSEVCNKPHPLVWAKLKGFPYWPAKVVRIADGNVDARFFGAHDRAWVPISQCYHLSKEMPTSSKPKKKGNYETALDELNVHVQLLIEKHGTFEYAPYRTTFDPENKHLMYHGINIDLATEDAQSGIVLNEGDLLNKAETRTDALKVFNEFENTEKTKIDVDSDSTIKVISDDASHAKEESKKLVEKESQLEVSDSSHCKSSLSSSDAFQRKKMELALQRIKGYITNDLDSEKEDEDKDTEKGDNEIVHEKKGDEEKDTEKCDNEKDSRKMNEEMDSDKSNSKVDESSDQDDKEDDICLSDLIKARTMPPIDLPSFEESIEKESPAILDTAKKNDSFSLKLIETIESCKAKLGISGDLDKSDSDSVEDDDEEEDEEEDEDDEESENEGREKNSKVSKKLDSSEEDASDESSSESDDADSVSSNTDIEMVEEVDDEVAGKDTEMKSEEYPTGKDGNNDALGSSTEKETLKDTESNVPPVNVSISGKTILLDTLCDGIALEGDSCENKSVTKSTPTKSASEVSEGDKCIQLDKENAAYPSPAARSRSVSSNALLSSTDDLTDIDMQLDAIENQTISKQDETLVKAATAPPTQSTEGNKAVNEEVIEDDDIYICPPVKPPTPPLICLDDGTETDPELENNAVSNSNKNKSPTSSPRTTLLPPPEDNICPENTMKYVSILKNAKLIPQNARKSSVKRPLRAVTSEDSSDEEIEVITRPSKVPTSGAIRTFNRERSSAATPPQVKHSRPDSPYPTGFEQSMISFEMGISKAFSDLTNEHGAIPEVIPETAANVTISMSDLAVKDAEIIRLKKKLSTVFSAFQLQRWKSAQEKSELRHNMNLIVMEMRSSLEADKKQAIENLTRNFEREKQRCIDETKKKQWCASCKLESRYSCCWNTSYCTVGCQKRHFADHRNFCTQLRAKSIDAEVVKPLQTTAITEPSKGKTVLVLNVLPNKDAKSSGDTSQENSQQVNLSKVGTPNLHLVSTSSSQSNSSVHYVLKSLKPGSSPTTALQKLTTSKPNNSDSTEVSNSAESELDSALSKSQEYESSKKNDEKAVEPSLEEIYFPSPPTICFEGLDTALPDENINFADLKAASESHVSDNELTIAEDSSEDEDMILSENDEVDNEMVSIGRGIDIKAKYLNKCLIYGNDAKKLTRCLVDVIFPDNLLAMCSAFGNKSNVTKLTRAALPYKKVEAIIEYVLRRFPGSTRSEITLAINMKCKEARVSVGKTDNSGKCKKTLFRRLLAREQLQDVIEKQQEEKLKSTPDTKEQTQETKDTNQDTTPANEASKSNPPKQPTTVTLFKNTPSSVVCLQTLPGSVPTSTATTSTSGNTPAGPNILCMRRQILIRPKYPTSAGPNKVMLAPAPSPPFRNRAPTVRSLLNMQQPLTSLSKDKNKMLLPIEMLQKALITNPAVKSPEVGNANVSQRPYIIIGSSQRPIVPTTQPPPTMTLKK